MPYNPKSLENLKKYPRGTSGNARGSNEKQRKKKEKEMRVIDQLKKVFKVDDVKAIFRDRVKMQDVDEWEQVILSMTASQLTALGKWDGCPAYAKNLAVSILFDMKSGKTTTIDKLRDRQFGKIPQRVEVTGANGEPLQPKAMTPDDAREMLAKLENEY